MQPPKQNTAVSAMEHLQRDACADRLLPTALRLLDIESHLKELLPATFRSAVEVCQLHDGELLLTVQSPALASKLKQALPRLREGITSRGWKVSSIVLTVQPASSTYKSGIYPQSTGSRKIPEQALVAWSEVLGKMPEGDLSRAVAKLLANHKPVRSD